jgi:hypothetical protein
MRRMGFSPGRVSISSQSFTKWSYRHFEADNPPPSSSSRRQPESGGLQRGDRPRSPPPRCMTVYADHTQPPDSILIPSTSGLRAVAHVHDFVPTSRNHSRQSSMSGDWDESVFARQQRHAARVGWSTPPRGVAGPKRSTSIHSHSPHPSASTTHSVYQHGNGNASSPQLQSPRRAISQRSLSHLQLPQSPSISQQQQSPYTPKQSQHSSHQPSTPVQPVLSSALAEPSTPAYNLLSAIATRTPGSVTDSDSDARNTRPDPRSGLGLRSDTGTVRGRGASGGWIAPLGFASKNAGPRRTQSATPSMRGSINTSPLKSREGAILPSSSLREGNVVSRPSASTVAQTGTHSPARSNPPSRTSTSSSVPSSAHRTPISSPSRNPVRHPFLQANRHPQMRGSVSDTEEDKARLQRYRSADALRRILESARKKAEEEAARRQEEESKKAAQEDATGDADRERGTVRAKARPRPALPTWSVIPRRGAPVALETIAPEGIVSIDGITGGSGRTKSASKRVGSLGLVTEPDPLVLPGEFSVSGPATAGSSIAKFWPLKEPVVPEPPNVATVSSASGATVTRQRSQSADPATRITSLLSGSLPKIAVFGKARAVGEPPPEEDSDGSSENKHGVVDKGKGKAVDKLDPIDEPSKMNRSSNHGARLSVQLNGTVIDPDAEITRYVPVIVNCSKVGY